MSSRRRIPGTSQVEPLDLASTQLNQLRHFFVVAEEQSFTRAAKRLRVGQPAISRAVRQLEDALGVTLIERGKGRGVRLTDVGRAVFARCEIAFGEIGRIAEIASEASDEPRGELLVAANEHVAIHLLPPHLAAMKRALPLIVPRIFTGPAHLLAPTIAAGVVELGLFFHLPEDTRLHREVIRREPCKIVVAAGREDDPDVLTAFIGSRELEDLENRRFPTVDFLRSHRPETSIRLSCSSLEAHKALVLRGCGVSILPTFTMERELAEGSLRVIHEEYSFDAQLSLVTLPQKKLGRAAGDLIDALRRP